MDKEILRYYAGLAVPRYTSYPTAVDFSADIDQSMHKDWLQALPATAEISLYIHIPYCREICHYCACHTKAAQRTNVVDSYLEFLLQELNLYKAALPYKLTVKHLHWGGGTPSILGAIGFKRMWAALQDVFTFSDNLEHAIELDPRVIDLDLMKSLADIRVNRVSFGIQDVDETVQKAIGRIQPLEQVAKACDMVREVGINDLNFDLMYGLPYQTLESLRRSCEIVLQFAPSRIACFGYAHLPKRRANQRLIPEAVLPNIDARLEQVQLLTSLLQNAGYRSIGIDHFALANDTLSQALDKGVLARNFQGYTSDDCDILLGIGSSSVSKLPEGYAQNIVDFRNYERAITSGNLPIYRGYVFKGQDKLRAKIISDLMCYFAVDLKKYGGASQFSSELERLQPLMRDGLIEIKDEVITMRQEAQLFVRVVAIIFDEFRINQHIGFSYAI